MSDDRTTYNVIVSGVTFTLNRASINSDSPDTNLLALSLFDDFADRDLVLNKNAASFQIIVDHLQDYEIFSLSEADCAGMGEEKMLRYLQNDCEYYDLARLKDRVAVELDRLRKARQAAENRAAARDGLLTDVQSE